MMRSAMILGTLVLVACGQKAGNTADTAAPRTAAAPAVPPEVQKAAAVRSGIAAAPDKADSVLAANGLTIAGFDSLMYRIAADSALRAAFASAR